MQAAVDAAQPGDWVLIWPGVYHERSTAWPSAGSWGNATNGDCRCFG